MCCVLSAVEFKLSIRFSILLLANQQHGNNALRGLEKMPLTKQVVVTRKIITLLLHGRPIKASCVRFSLCWVVYL